MSFKKIGRDFSKASDSELIVAVRQCIARQPGAELTLNRLAEKLGVNPRQLSAAFQRNLGVSIAVYVRSERMRIAQRLLLQTSMSIHAVAASLGFSCPANFSSAFRDFTGMTPSEFRKQPSSNQTLTSSSDVKWGQGPV